MKNEETIKELFRVLICWNLILTIATGISVVGLMNVTLDLSKQPVLEEITDGELLEYDIQDDIEIEPMQIGILR